MKQFIYIKKIKIKIGMIILLFMSLSGCASLSNPTQKKMQIVVHAVSYLNPSVDNIPSPLVLNVYQLRSNSIFEKEDFYSIYQNPSQALGTDLIDRTQIEIRPEEKKELHKTLSLDTEYVGVIAAFRDLNHSQWRAVTPIPKSKHFRLMIDIGSQSVSVRTK